MITIQQRFARLIEFKINQWINGIRLSDMPFFEPAALDYFASRLERSTLYVEYGAGGSTIQAARLKRNFITVESDQTFLKAIKCKIKRDFGEARGLLVHANVGITEKFGEPFIKRKTEKRLLRWQGYAAAPWQFVEPNELPDLILVDGRFRVSCVLYSIKQMRNYDYEILFDDYFSRPHYRVTERFTRIHSTLGRMAILKPKQYDPHELDSALKEYFGDYR
jgi:hypothetical protein